MILPPESADRPVFNPETEDVYWRRSFGKQLASLLLAGSENPPVIGVVGEWGSGKTTVMNFAEFYVQEINPEIEILRFNPWSHVAGGRGAIQEALLAQVTDQVLSKLGKFKKNAQKLFQEYAGGLIRATPLPGKELVATATTKAIARLPSTRERLEKVLREEKISVVVLVDDVDRLVGSELMELFAALRVVVDLPFVQYVLAYDQSSVAAAIEATVGGNGHDFLEKIVAVPLSVPTIPFRLLMRRSSDGIVDVLQAANLDTSTLEGLAFKSNFHEVAQFLRA